MICCCSSTVGGGDGVGDVDVGGVVVIAIIAASTKISSGLVGTGVVKMSSRIVWFLKNKKAIENSRIENFNKIELLISKL